MAGIVLTGILAANISTSLLVLAATPLGLSVSTTHVSTGSLMGIRWAGNYFSFGRNRRCSGDLYFEFSGLSPCQTIPTGGPTSRISTL